MLDIVISFLTFVLILISLFMVLVILMQRANSNSGMGSAFGGGVTESAFGAETTNILTRATKWSAVGFFLLSLLLYLLYMGRESSKGQEVEYDLPDVPASSQEQDLPTTTMDGSPAPTGDEVSGEEAESTPAP